LGQALENYNAIGEWRLRERDTGALIDPTGELAGGGKVGRPSDLRVAISTDPNQFVQALTEKLLTYALGRTVQYYDMPTVRAIVRESARDHYSFASIATRIAKSTAFRMRSVPQDKAAETVATAAER
jgi:hypothetical protein